MLVTRPIIPQPYQTKLLFSRYLEMDELSKDRQEIYQFRKLMESYEASVNAAVAVNADNASWRSIIVNSGGASIAVLGGVVGGAPGMLGGAFVGAGLSEILNRVLPAEIFNTVNIRDLDDHFKGLLAQQLSTCSLRTDYTTCANIAIEQIDRLNLPEGGQIYLAKRFPEFLAELTQMRKSPHTVNENGVIFLDPSLLAAAAGRAKASISNINRLCEASHNSQSDIGQTFAQIKNHIKDSSKMLEKSINGVRIRQESLSRQNIEMIKKVDRIKHILKHPQPARSDVEIQELYAAAQSLSQLGALCGSPVIRQFGTIASAGLQMYLHAQKLSASNTSLTLMIASGLGLVVGLVSIIASIFGGNDGQERILQHLQVVETNILNALKNIFFSQEQHFRELHLQVESISVQLQLLQDRVDMVFYQQINSTIYAIMDSPESDPFFVQMDNPTFLQKRATLLNWLRREAASSIANGSDLCSLSDEKIITQELTRKPTHSVLGYLVPYIAQKVNSLEICTHSRGQISLDVPQILINPILWVSVTEAYLKLRITATRFNKEIDFNIITKEIDSVISVGNDMINCLKDIRSEIYAEPLLTELFWDYEESLLKIWSARMEVFSLKRALPLYLLALYFDEVAGLNLLGFVVEFRQEIAQQRNEFIKDGLARNVMDRIDQALLGNSTYHNVPKIDPILWTKLDCARQRLLHLIQLLYPQTEARIDQIRKILVSSDTIKQHLCSDSRPRIYPLSLPSIQQFVFVLKIIGRRYKALFDLRYQDSLQPLVMASMMGGLAGQLVGRVHPEYAHINIDECIESIKGVLANDANEEIIRRCVEEFSWSNLENLFSNLRPDPLVVLDHNNTSCILIDIAGDAALASLTPNEIEQFRSIYKPGSIPPGLSNTTTLFLSTSLAKAEVFKNKISQLDISNYKTFRFDKDEVDIILEIYHTAGRADICEKICKAASEYQRLKETPYKEDAITNMEQLLKIKIADLKGLKNYLKQITKFSSHDGRSPAQSLVTSRTSTRASSFSRGVASASSSASGTSLPRLAEAVGSSISSRAIAHPRVLSPVSYPALPQSSLASAITIPRASTQASSFSRGVASAPSSASGTSVRRLAENFGGSVVRSTPSTTLSLSISQRPSRTSSSSHTSYAPTNQKPRDGEL